MRDMPSPIKPRFAPYPDLEEFLEPFVARGLDSLENTVAVRGVNVPINLKSARNKFKQLLFQFEGKPELAVVHALLISASRKDSWPESAQAYFMDMWAKKPDCLLQQLDWKWRGSAMQTFSIFGDTKAQIKVASEMTLLFELIRAYETERLFTGYAPKQTFPLGRRSNAPLPLGLVPFNLLQGDMIENLELRLRRNAAQDRIILPLATIMLDAIFNEKSGVFHRLGEMREQMHNAILNTKR